MPHRNENRWREGKTLEADPYVTVSMSGNANGRTPSTTETPFVHTITPLTTAPEGPTEPYVTASMAGKGGPDGDEGQMVDTNLTTNAYNNTMPPRTVTTYGTTPMAREMNGEYHKHATMTQLDPEVWMEQTLHRWGVKTVGKPVTLQQYGSTH